MTLSQIFCAPDGRLYSYKGKFTLKQEMVSIKPGLWLRIREMFE